MIKNKLIQEIKTAFQNVKLEDGIGLWEAQGHDDRLSDVECKKLRLKDEINDWNKIAIENLYTCSSSLSFFDAKGLRFHMPKYLLLALQVYKDEEENLQNKKVISLADTPDIDSFLTSYVSIFKNTANSEYKIFHKERFSLFTVEQLKCLIDYLEYKKNELEIYYTTNEAKAFGLQPEAVKYDKEYILLQETIQCFIEEFQVK